MIDLTELLCAIAMEAGYRSHPSLPTRPSPLTERARLVYAIAYMDGRREGMEVMSAATLAMMRGEDATLQASPAWRG